MEYVKKASMSPHKKKMKIIGISIIGAVCLVAVLLAVLSICKANYIYAVLYIVAALLAAAYVIIKINSVMPLYIAADDNNVYIQCWRNGAFPYDINFKPAFFADFVPDKVIKKEIPIEKITRVFVGSKNYLARNLEDTDFAARAAAIEKNRGTEKNAVRRMDFICIADNSGEIYFMPVTDIDSSSLAELVNYIYRKKPDTEIKCNLREIRTRLTI